MTAMAWVQFALWTSVKALLVMTLAFGLTRMMRSRSAAERHLVWMLASVCVLALPLLALAGPSWRVPLPSWGVTPATATATPVATARVTPVPVHHPAQHAAPVARGTVAPVPTVPIAPVAPASSAGAAVGVAPADEAASLRAPERSALPFVLFIAWSIGASLVLLRMALAFIQVKRLVARSRPLLDPVLLVRAHGVAAETGLSRSVRFLEGDEDTMPVTFGILRPTLLLPSIARDWSAARQDAVLRHELSHIRRRDALSQLVAELACAVHWFNPLVWYAASRMCAEREHACDDAVLKSGLRASDYAADLLGIARALRASSTTAVAAIAMARQSHLRSRVALLLDSGARRERATRLMAPAWIGAFLIVTPLSSIAPQLGGRVQELAVDESKPAARSLPSPVGRTPLPDAQAMLAPAAPISFNATGATGLYAQEDCLSGDKTSVNSNSNDDRRTIKWSGRRCSGEVVVQGEVRFDDAFTTITGVSEGGFVRISTEENGDERSVRITPAAGSVAYDYRVNGDRRELDAAGRQWVQSTLLFMFRRLGFMADERATAILRRGGVNALISEVEILRGDYVRARYLAAAIEHGRLDTGSLRRVLTLAGNSVESDYYRTEIVTSIAGRYEFDDAMRDAYLTAVSGIESDYYRFTAYSTIAETGGLSSAQLADVLRASSAIESDYYRASLLAKLATRYRATPEIRTAYLDAATRIESDYYKADVLAKLLQMEGLRTNDLTRVLDATSSIESDHYLQGVLAQVAARDLEAPTLLALISAAGEVESDYNRSELMATIARRHQLRGEARAQFEKLMQEIGSDTYRERVATALRRN